MVDDGGDPAGSRRRGDVTKIGWARKAGLPLVGVRIDHSRQDVEALRVNQLPFRLELASDLCHNAGPNAEVGRSNSGTADDVPAANQQRATHRSTRTRTSVGFPPAVSVMSWGQAEIAMMAGISARSRM